MSVYIYVHMLLDKIARLLIIKTKILITKFAELIKSCEISVQTISN